jgi:hypothetical protein
MTQGEATLLRKSRERERERERRQREIGNFSIT